MKKIFTSALIILLLCAANLLKAQKDYVITLTGDTLLGKIKKPFLDGLKFQEVGKKESIYISTEVYKEYHFSKDSTHYVAVKLSESKKLEFLKRLEYGKIQLFVRVLSNPGMMGAGGVMMGGGSTSYWYAGFDLDNLKEIKTNGLLGTRSQREKNFHSLIESYPELLEDFKNEKDFSIDMLRAYVKKYNYYFKYLKKDNA